MTQQYNGLKGMFAEADSFRYGRRRTRLTAFVAGLALASRLICKDSEYGNLADVEMYLREIGSPLYFLAAPVSAIERPYRVSYGWLPDGHPQREEQPPYSLIVASNRTVFEGELERSGENCASNIRHLGQTGMLPLVTYPIFRERLEELVPGIFELSKPFV